MRHTIQTGIGAQEKIIAGALTAAATIGLTHGPRGRTVMIQRPMGLITTKDGVTVARNIILSDRLENMGAQIIQDACTKVNSETGDGTTTTAILIEAILKEGLLQLAAGVYPDILIREMKDDIPHLQQAIVEMSIPVQDQKTLEHVALIASNQDTDISALLAEACMAIGSDGTLVIEDGVGTESTLEFKEGVEIARRPISRHMLKGNNERVMEAPLVAVIDQSLFKVSDVQSLLETASQWPNNPLLIFARTIDRDAFKTIVLNDSKSVVLSCAYNSPMFGEHLDFLKDMAAISGAHLVSSAGGDDHKEWQGEWFGACRKAVIRPQQTVLTAYPDKHEFIESRIKELVGQKNLSESEYQTDQLIRRIARLSEGLAVLKVGGVTEAAMKERRGRIEDALAATRSALRGGIVPGGGKSYWILSKLAHSSVLAQSLQAPLRHLADPTKDAGIPDIPDNTWIGWDASQGILRDFREGSNIIDPAPVVSSAITTAISAASEILRIAYGVTLPPESLPRA